jgi:hypothetical protein
MASREWRSNRPDGLRRGIEARAPLLLSLQPPRVSGEPLPVTLSDRPAPGAS